MTRPALILWWCLLLTGCAPWHSYYYHPLGISGGYSEIPQGARGYVVSMSADGALPDAWLEGFLLYRSAVLASERRAACFRLSAPRDRPGGRPTTYGQYLEADMALLDGCNPEAEREFDVPTILALYGDDVRRRYRVAE